MRPATLATLALVVGLGGAGGAAFAAARGQTPQDGRERGSGEGRHEVRIKAVAFNPTSLVVQLGDTVVWRNADIVRHNVVSGELFASAELSSGETFAWAPGDTGTVRYRCTIHPRMRGELTVRLP